MLLRLCQLKSRSLFLITLITLSSCSQWKRPAPNGSEILTTFPNHWFSVNADHSLQGTQGGPVPHVIFDTEPEFRLKNRLVNVIISTPENSQHAYEIDLYSGQRHYSHTYCKQKDIWNNYTGIIHRPVFSVGIIPKILDQIGEPQKVIVWSRNKNYHETAVNNYRDVKLVGAFVEQICQEGNCLGKSNWLSRLVFIGVDGDDRELDRIQNVTDFKKVFDWETSKAHLENINGRNFIGDRTYPAIRVGQLIEYDDAFDFFRKRSIFLTDKELKKIQNGCHALYNNLWEEVGRIRPEDVSAKTNEEYNKKRKLIEELKHKKLPVGFAARLHKFTKKYFNEVTTCEKFVYHGNINRNPEAFWFLSYMGIYYRLHKEGYYFDCKAGTWQRNVLNVQGERIYDLKNGISQCNEQMLDQAMDYLPNFLTGLKSEKEYFTFIDYDNHTHGTHNKMYAWIKLKSLKLNCSSDPNVTIKKEMKLFPEDVRWKNRKVKDTAPDSRLIY